VRRASIAVLKARLSEYVDAATVGEETIVTDRNVPVARLCPVGVPARHEARVAFLCRAGLARPAERALSREFWDRPRPKDRRGRALTVLIEERHHDR